MILIFFKFKGDAVKNLVLLSSFILAGFCSVFAQQSPQATPTPVPQGNQNQQDINRRFNGLRSIEMLISKEVSDSETLREHTKPLYREPEKDELKFITPNTADFEKFSGFLRQPNTGLIKLIPERNCDGDGKVTSSAPECLKYPFPGAGSSYSFRINNYRLRRLADLNFTGKNFRAFGILTHGILVNLGNIPLENINLQSEAVIALMKLPSSEDFKEAEEFTRKLNKGFPNDSFIYRNLLPATENTTYLLRSIAYRGNLFQSVQGITYDEMKFDKRKDIVVAFRVVRRDEDDSITLLWKELANKDAPKIKQSKK